MSATLTLEAPAAPRVTVIAPGEGTPYSVLGHTVVCLLSAEQTGGVFSLFASTIPPGGGPPPHAHTVEDETFYVLDGTFAFLDNDQTVTAGAGTCVHAPRGSRHTFQNIGPAAGTLLTVVTPGGFERFFADMDTLPAGPPDMARLMAIAARHRITYAAPAAPAA